MTIIIYAVVNKKSEVIKMAKTISRDKIVRRSKAIIRVLAPLYNQWTLVLLGYEGLMNLYLSTKGKVKL